MRRITISLILLLSLACREELPGEGTRFGDDCDTEGAVRCDGDVLQECVESFWEDLEDCAMEGGFCHEEMVHCM